MEKEEKMEKKKKKKKMETRRWREGVPQDRMSEESVMRSLNTNTAPTNQPWGVRVEKEIERREVTRGKVRRKRTEVKRRRRWPREEEVEKKFNGSEEVRGCKEFSRLGRN